MKKKILIIIYTHGDEKIGESIVKKLQKKKLGEFFDCLVANPVAARKGVRFIEADLNRSYPGVKKSKIYEKRLAFKNLQIAKRYEFVIDIHEASSGINDFIIIPRKNGLNTFPLNLVDLDIVLFWPDPKGPMGEILENSIELEFGTKLKNRNKIILKGQKIMENFIERAYFGNIKNNFLKKKRYYVYGKLVLKDFLNYKQTLIDFKKTSLNGEKFYPLLVGQYLNDGIVCYKMKLL